jgi:hypothetical protein
MLVKRVTIILPIAYAALFSVSFPSSYLEVNEMYLLMNLGCPYDLP